MIIKKVILLFINQIVANMASGYDRPSLVLLFAINKRVVIIV